MDLTHNIIEYVNCCVGAFANRFSLTLAQSYAYLRRFKGIYRGCCRGYNVVMPKEWRTIGMLTLYHGSNVVIDKIDLCRSRKGKDFGCYERRYPISDRMPLYRVG